MTLTLASQSGLRATVVCDAFRAQGVFPFLPEEFDRVRLTGEDFSAVLSPSIEGERRELVATLAISIPQGLVPISRLKGVVDLARVLIAQEHDPFTLKLSNGVSESELRPGGVTSVQPLHRDLTEGLHHALCVCSHFGVSDGVLVHAGELFEQAEWASFMHAMTSTDRDGRLVAPFDKPVPVGEKFGVVHQAALHLPDQILVQLVGAYGLVTECLEVPGRGARIVVESGCLLERRHVLERDSEENETLLAAHTESLRSELVALGCVSVSDPDQYRRLVGSAEGSTGAG